MRNHAIFALLVGLIICGGCHRAKTTDELLDDLKSSHERDRIIAVRLLPERKAEGDRVVPALIESLNDKHDDVRLSAAIGLGSFGEAAVAAVPALMAAQRDSDARIRRAAGVALSRIDPKRAPSPAASERRRQ